MTNLELSKGITAIVSNLKGILEYMIKYLLFLEPLQEPPGIS